MDNEVPDWIHLPPGLEPRSLWVFLHDAVLHTIRSDTLERSAVLEFRIFYLREQPDQQEGLTIQIRLTDVTSVRAITFVHWPGPAPETLGKSYDEQTRLVSEYQAKGREETLSWSELENALMTADFGVLQAWLASSEEGVTLHLEGVLDDEHWCAVFVRAGSLSISRNDGSGITLDELEELGAAYWQGFGKRRASGDLEPKLVLPTRWVQLQTQACRVRGGRPDGSLEVARGLVSGSLRWGLGAR